MSRLNPTNSPPYEFTDDVLDALYQIEDKVLDADKNAYDSEEVTRNFLNLARIELVALVRALDVYLARPMESVV